MPSRSLTYIIISNIEIHILFPIAANLNFAHGVFSVAVKFIDITACGEVENIGLVQTKGIQLITRKK